MEESPKIEKKKWFKFYGADFLLDPKMMELNSTEKIMWVTLMCLASANGEDGWVRHINNIRLATFAGVTPLDDDYNLVKGTLEHFEELSMITIEKLQEYKWDVYLLNFVKRQTTNLTPYERVKKHREKVKASTESTKKLSMITTDKIREDKKRKEISNVEIQSIYDLYISKFKKNPKQVKLTDKRKQKIKQRLSDAGHEMLAQSIIRVAKSPFHNGDNDRGWSADLDFIIRSYEQVEKLSQLESVRPKDKKSDHIPYRPPQTTDFTDIGAEIMNRYGG